MGTPVTVQVLLFIKLGMTLLNRDVFEAVDQGSERLHPS